MHVTIRQKMAQPGAFGPQSPGVYRPCGTCTMGLRVTMTRVRSRVMRMRHGRALGLRCTDTGENGVWRLAARQSAP